MNHSLVYLEAAHFDLSVEELLLQTSDLILQALLFWRNTLVLVMKEDLVLSI